MENEKTLIQKKIELAQSEHAPIVIELMKDLIEHGHLLGGNEYETVVNAVRFDTQSTMLTGMVDLLESIRGGALHQVKM